MPKENIYWYQPIEETEKPDYCKLEYNDGTGWKSQEIDPKEYPHCYYSSVDVPSVSAVRLLASNEYGQSEWSNIRYLPEPGSRSILLLILIVVFTAKLMKK